MITKGKRHDTSSVSDRERDREKGEILFENSRTKTVAFKTRKDGFPVDGGGRVVGLLCDETHEALDEAA